MSHKTGILGVVLHPLKAKVISFCKRFLFLKSGQNLQQRTSTESVATLQ
jgi:hypothetical protein